MNKENLEVKLIKGAFFLEQITEEVIEKIINLGVNQISLKWEYCNKELISQLQRRNIKVFAEIGLFVDEAMWQKYPDSRPIDRAGNFMERINWYYGVCPNHQKIRAEKLATIDQVLDTLNIDGIWLDFIRYPCHWEDVRNSQIKEYCFCENCLTKYENDVGKAPEGDDWISWKCQQITEFVQDVRDQIKKSDQRIQLGMFAVPWKEDTYRGAIRSIIGQDFSKLSRHIDIFGMMTYHKLTAQPIDWIEEIVDNVKKSTGKLVVPLVQSMDVPVTVSTKEFEQAIDIAFGGASQGVIVFHFHDLLKNETKYNIVKNKFATDYVQKNLPL